MLPVLLCAPLLAQDIPFSPTVILRDVAYAGSSALAVMPDGSSYTASYTTDYSPNGFTCTSSVSHFDQQLNPLPDLVLPSGYTRLVASALVGAPDGTLWVGFRACKGADNVGLLQFSPTGQLLRNLSVPGITALYADNTGILAATLNSDILSFSPDGVAGPSVTLPAGRKILALRRDLAGNIVAGGKSGPIGQTAFVSRFDSQMVPAFDYSTDTAMHVTFGDLAMAVDGTTVLAATTQDGDSSRLVSVSTQAPDPAAGVAAPFLMMFSPQGQITSATFVPKLNQVDCVFSDPNGDTLAFGVGPGSAIRLVKLGSDGGITANDLNYGGTVYGCTRQQSRLSLVTTGVVYDPRRYSATAINVPALQTIDLESQGPAPLQINVDALVFTMLMLPGKSVPDRPMSFHVDSPDSSTQMAVFRGAGDVQWMSAPADVDFSPTSYFVRTPWIYSPGRQNALQMLPMSIGMAQPKLSVQPLYTVVSDPSQAPFVLTVPLHSFAGSFGDQPAVYRVEIAGPPCFSIDRNSVTTPFDLKIGIDPSKNAWGNWRATITLTGQMNIWGGTESASFDVLLRNGTPDFILDPPSLDFVFDGTSTVLTQAVHIGTTGVPLHFIADVGAGFSQYQFGLTPNDLVIPVSALPSYPYIFTQTVQIWSPESVKINLPVTVINLASKVPGRVSCPNPGVPGALLTCTLPVEASRGSLHLLLDGSPVAVDSLQYPDISFRLPKLTPGGKSVLLEVFDEKGQLRASGSPIAAQGLVPVLQAVLGNGGPVAPGDHIVARFLNCGARVPSAWASFGTKYSKVTRVEIADDPDIVEVEVEIPPLTDGDHKLVITISHVDVPISVSVLN